MKTKRIIGAILAMIFLVPAVGIASDMKPLQFVYGDYDCTVLEDGISVEISRYNGKEAKIEIPSSLEGYMIVSIGDKAFSDHYELTDVSIPDTVIRTGRNPFELCPRLQTIYVSPNNPGLAVIDSVLFSKEDKRLVCYPCGLQDMEYKVPEGIQIIGEAAFKKCESLFSIVIPATVTTIGADAFFKCTDLALVDLPESIELIGEQAFCKCDSLESFTFPRNVAVISSNILTNCQNLTEVSLPDGVLEIEWCAFRDCKAMKEITLPATVEKMGYGIFDGCDELIVKVAKGSFAEQYCLENGIRYAYIDGTDWLQ